MYLSTLPFQQSNPMTQKPNPFAPSQSGESKLQQISNKLTAKQTEEEMSVGLSKTEQIQLDAYTEVENDAVLEAIPTQLLEFYMHTFRFNANLSQGYEQELTDFKEQLQEWDATIQGYQDILDGTAALQEGQTMEEILLSLTQAKEGRAQFLEDGIAHLNEMGENCYGYAMNRISDHGLEAVFGENPFAEGSISDWNIDPNATDFYGELDRLTAKTHSMTETYQEGIGRMYDILKERGSEEEYQTYLHSWYDPTNSYFDRTKEQTIQKVMIDRLMNTPLQDAENKGIE